MSTLNPHTPPILFMPPADQAHDVYSLGDHIVGFQPALYQDIQWDQLVYDSFQRWPHLFSKAMPEAQ